MRYIFGFPCVCVLSAVTLVGCFDDLFDDLPCADVVCRDDGNECTWDDCRWPPERCEHGPVEDGTACDLDGFADVCIDGVCGGAVGQPPQIILVEWQPWGSCSQGSASDYIVTVTATDPDSDPMSFTYDGSVVGCAGQIDGMVSTITCPNAAPSPGSVVVFDGDGNVSDPVNFQIGVCESGSAPQPGR